MSIRRILVLLTLLILTPTVILLTLEATLIKQVFSLLVSAVAVVIIWSWIDPALRALQQLFVRHGMTPPGVSSWPETIRKMENTLLEKMREIQRIPLQIAETVRKQEYVDEETKLGNRRFFDARIDVLLLKEQFSGEGVLLLVSLTGFNELPDELQKKQVIHAASTLMQNALKDFSNSVISRRSRTEFAIVVYPVTKNQSVQIAELIERALQMLPLAQDYFAENFFHIGVVTFEPGMNRYDLLSKADLSLRSAQLRGGNGWFKLDDDADTSARGMVQWRTLFDRVLNTRAIVCMAQPVHSFVDARIIHREVFARIITDQGEQITAAEFIPMAKACGFLDRLDRLVIDQTLKSMTFTDEHCERICLNLSLDSLLDPTFLSWLIQRVATNSGLSGRIDIEVAERPMAGKEKVLTTSLNRLKNIGIRIGLDHVGEQLVNFDYFDWFPLDYAKIHRSVLAHIGSQDDQRERLLIQTLAQVAQSREFLLLAEGIESDVQRQILEELGVRGGQGFLWSRPVRM